MKHLESVEEKMTALQSAHTSHLEKMNGEATEMAEAAGVLSQSFNGVQQGLNGLNMVLTSLGEKQVLIQQVEAPRKRWGLFGNSKRVR